MSQLNCGGDNKTVLIGFPHFFVLAGPPLLSVVVLAGSVQTNIL